MSGNLPITPVVEMRIQDEPVATEGFEGTGPPYAFSTSNGGTSNWAPSTTRPFFQSKSLKSPTLTNGQQCDFNMVTPAGATKIRFWYAVDVGSADFFKVFVNGVQRAALSSSVDWTQFEASVGEGQTVTVQYQRNAGGGGNAAYIDNVQFLADMWVAITDDCRLNSAHSGGGIKIKRGRPNESPIAEASECNLVLNNQAGKWSELNPASPYFGRLGRNQPIRVALRRIRDDFNHTETNTWGTTPTWVDSEQVTRSGYPWTIIGTAANFDMASGNATIQAVTGDQSVYLSTFADVDIKVRVMVSDRTSQFGVLLRTNASGTEQIRAVITPGGTDTFTIVRVASAVTLTLNTNMPFQVVANTWYWLRAQITGRRYRMKFWADGTDQPTQWDKTYADNRQITDGTFGATGGAGCFVRNGSALVTYSEIEFNVWRAHTEVVAFPVKFDLSQTDRWVPFKTRGILRRLGQGRKALDSALTHHLSQYVPGSLMWYPFESTDGIIGSNGVPGGIPAILSGASQESPELTGAKALPGVSGLIRMSEDTSSFLGQVSNHPNVNQAWTCLGFWQVDSLPASQQTLFQYTATGTGATWKVTVDNAGNIGVYAYDSVGNLVGSSVNAVLGAVIPVGSWISCALYVFDSGGTVNWAWNLHRPEPGEPFYSINGTFAGSAGVFRSVSHTSNSVWTAAGGVRLAQFLHYTKDLPFVAADFANAAAAYKSETNINRFSRLCTDAGIPFSVIGDTNTHGHQMGAQLPAKRLDLLTDCAEVGAFNLEEDRDDFGLVLRSRQSVYNGPIFDMDVDGGHLVDPLDPAPDDQATRNDVTVSRPGGGFARAIQETGDLNINDPEADVDGVGVYDEQVEQNYYADAQLSAAANWRLSRGTLKVPRYPSLPADLTAEAYNTSLAITALMLSLDSGSLARVRNPQCHPSALIQGVQGYEEEIDQYDLDITVTSTPGDSYIVGVVGTTTRVEPAGIITADPIVVGTTTSFKCRRIDASLYGLWVPTATDAAVSNFDILIAGVRLHVNSITGSSDPQTININAAPTNDSGTGFTIPPGQNIRLADPWRIAW